MIMPKNWWVLLATSLALAVLFLDQTAVSVALPIMQHDLNANNTELQWIMNSYLLVTACVLILGGKLGDMLGHKRLFTIGMSVFIVGSCLIALAHRELWVIVNRGIQGLGAALLIPPINVIVISNFCNKTRGRAMGIQVAIASIFLSIGPLIGGYLTQEYSWRWIFWINLPIGIISMLVVAQCTPKIQRSPHKIPAFIDWPGFILLAAAIFCVTFSLMQTGQWGWTNKTNLLMFTLGGICIYAFYKFEKKQKHPLVNFTLFKDPGFLNGSLILLLIQTNFIARIFIIIYFQTVLGYSVLMAGVLSLPGTVPVLFAAPFGGYLRDKYGPRLPVVIGSLLIIISSLWISGFVWLYDFWYLMPGFIAFSLGAPMVISTARTAAIATIPTQNRGVASGICNTARQVGGTIGLAMMSTIVISLDKLHLNKYIETGPEALRHLTADQLSGLLAGTTEATAKIAHLNPQQAIELEHAAGHAFTFGLSFGMLVIGIIGFSGVWLAMRLPKD